MKRFQVAITLATVVLVLDLGAQGPPPGGAARPGLPPGAQFPGVPPRDTNSAAAAQTGTASVRGRVVALQAGTPLRRAQITLTSMEGGQVRRVTTSDGEGRYEFKEVPAGRFAVSATKAGFVTLQFGQRRPFEAGTPITIADGQAIERVDFSLPRGSVIAVRITDEFGEPISGAMVQVQRYQYGPDGQRRLTTAQGAPTPFAGTDDRGEFRAYGLMPGEYVIMASVRNVTGPPPAGAGSNDTSEGFATTYYPGTTSSAEAQAITVGVGEETPVQFSLVPSRMGRVSGRVLTSDGRPAAGAQLTVMTTIGNGMTSYGAGQVAPDGSFVVSGLAPGEHSLQISERRPGVPGEFASYPLVVGGTDITGLQITMARGATVRGTVIFDGTSPRTAGPAPLRAIASPADPGRQFASLGLGTDPLANGTLDDQGAFTLGGVSGRVFFGVGPVTPGWVVQSVRLEGDDITDVPVDMTGRPDVAELTIVLTDKLTTVSGQVTDARGALQKDYVVVILPLEEREPLTTARSTRVVRPDTNGKFETRGLRPGRYVAAAVESLEQGRQFAPEFQQRLRQGAREFALRDAEGVTLDLRLTEGL